MRLRQPAKAPANARARSAPARAKSATKTHPGKDPGHGSGVGNQTMQQMLEQFSIQTKLTVNEPGDRFEREANTVADRVMRMPDPVAGGISGVGSSAFTAPAVQRQQLSENEEKVQRACDCEERVDRAAIKEEKNESIQRMCAKCQQEMNSRGEEDTALPWAGEPRSSIQRLCSECEKEQAQREHLSHSGSRSSTDRTVDPKLTHEIRALEGRGRPLPDRERSFFEPRFDRDFSHVRVHAESNDAQTAQALSARAFTFGRHVVFGSGQYSPHTDGGRRLIAHELAHTVQQSPHVGRKRRKGDSLAAAQASPSAGAVAPSPRLSPSAPSAGQTPNVQRDLVDDLVAAAETVGTAVTTAGEAVGEAVSSAGEAVGEAAETVAGFAAELWDSAQAFAGALGSVVQITGGSLVIRVPGGIPVCPTIVQNISLGELSGTFPLAFEAAPLYPPVLLYGEVGVHAGFAPELGLQLGPCELHGLVIKIDPAGPSFSAAGGVTATMAASIVGETRLTLLGEVGLLIVVPPAAIPIPVVTLEAGLLGSARAIGAQTVSIDGVMSYAGGRFSLDAVGDAQLGLALDAGIAGTGQLSLLGMNLCRMNWPLWDWHKEFTLQEFLDLKLNVDSQGASAQFIVEVSRLNPFSFDDMGILLRDNLLGDVCPICDVIRFLGLMPSQTWAGWKGHPTPPWPGPLPSVYPRNPADLDPKQAYRSKCRGVCGPDCAEKACGTPVNRIVCQQEDDHHVFWEYPNYVHCGSNAGCREHDECYDQCQRIGFPIWGPCHRICDFECLCDYGVPQCVGWAFGNGPYDSYMEFSDAPRVIGKCRGQCPQPITSGPSPLFEVCLPDIPIFDRQGYSDSWSSPTLEKMLFATVVNPPYIGPVVLSVNALGGASAGFAVGVGPARLTRLCLIYDPSTGEYKGTGEFRLSADLSGFLNLTVGLNGRADWLCLVTAALVEGTLTAGGRAALNNEFVAAAQVSCQQGQLVLDTDVSVDACPSLEFTLDGGFRIALFSFDVFSRTWRLGSWTWGDCWRIPLGATSGAIGLQSTMSVPGAQASSLAGTGSSGSVAPVFPTAEFQAAEMLTLLSAAGTALIGTNPIPEALDFEDAVSAGSDNPCGASVKPEDECGSKALPLTEAVWSGSDRGENVVAQPLTKCKPRDFEGSRPSVTFPAKDCIDRAVPPEGGKEGRFWVRAHLLHGPSSAAKKRKGEHLHGPGNKKANLIMTNKSLNGQMFSQVENDAVKRILRYEVLWYEVHTEHYADTGDLRYFGRAMTMSYGTWDTENERRGPTIFPPKRITSVPGSRQPPRTCT